MPTWVGPTAAIALIVIAASLLLIGGVLLSIGIGLHQSKRHIGAQLAAFSADAKAAAARLRHEVDGYADLSAQTRGKLKRAVHKVEERLLDVDALVEVLQEEAEEAAIDVAALVRTARRSASIFGVARAALRARRRKG
jgi:hypothetical protein